MLNYKVETAYDAEQANIYDMERFKKKSGIKIHETELEHLYSAISIVSEIKPQLTILEVGCGTGRLLVEVCIKGYKVDGIDASPDMLAQCNKKILGQFPDTKIALGEATELPYPNNSYDFIYSIRLLNQTESCEYALNIISEMVRVTKANGYLLVEFVNYYRLRLGRRKYLGVRLRPKKVINYANKHGATVIWCHGAFFFGMTFLHILPDFLLDYMNKIDKIFCKLFPKLCSRCYVLLQTKER